MNCVIYSSLCTFVPPKVNCAIYSAWLVYAYDLGSIAQFRKVFPGELCSLQLAVCICAQSELRHLQCRVSVCVCVDMIWGKLPYFREFCLVNCVIYSSLCDFMSPKMNCAMEFFAMNCVICSSLCIFYVSQSELRHLHCTVIVLYVCASRGGLLYFGDFFRVNCVIYSSLCAFYVSQSELRHLQCIVSVCVCACI